MIEVGACVSDLLLRRRTIGAFDGVARVQMAVQVDRTTKASESAHTDIDRVECNAPIAGSGAALRYVECTVCVSSRAHAYTRPARQCLQSLVASKSVNDISAEPLMRTEQELVISGPAACGSITVANAIGVKAISCHGARRACTRRTQLQSRCPE